MRMMATVNLTAPSHEICHWRFVKNLLELRLIRIQMSVNEHEHLKIIIIVKNKSYMEKDCKQRN
jgi:hypothetical protein